jgi:hypothetical protein
VDGYDGFKALRRDRDDGAVVLAFCWAHLRRRFFDIHAATQSPIAAEAVQQIGVLYAIEAEIRGRTPETDERSGRRVPRRCSVNYEPGRR